MTIYQGSSTVPNELGGASYRRSTVSTLIAIAYPDETRAQAALAKLQELQRSQLITIDDAVIARHQGDKIKLDQAFSTAGAGAAGGALWGGLFGLIFLMPIAGMAIGAASGALAGKLTDYGIDDKFAKEMATKIGPGQAALVLLVRNATTDRVVAEMKKGDFGGELIQSNLSEEDEAKLREAASASA
jgi:uncharacterized membrane protein